MAINFLWVVGTNGPPTMGTNGPPGSYTFLILVAHWSPIQTKYFMCGCRHLKTICRRCRSITIYSAVAGTFLLGGQVKLWTFFYRIVDLFSRIFSKCGPFYTKNSPKSGLFAQKVDFLVPKSGPFAIFSNFFLGGGHVPPCPPGSYGTA